MEGLEGAGRASDGAKRVAWKKQDHPWDSEGPLTELRGSQREPGEPLTELGGSQRELGGPQREPGCPQRKLGGPHKVQ